MLEIVKYPDETLRQISEKVELPLSKEDKALLDEMYRWVKDNQDKAVGLSAIQVGVPKRMCAIRSCSKGHNFAYKLVNPKIIMRSPRTFVHTEGCLSVENESWKVSRHESVTVTAYDAIANKNVLIKATGFDAAILQHEIDHMDGILYIDKKLN